MSDAELRAHREALVRRHMEAENVHDFDAVIDTFSHPRYELIATDRTHDAAAAWMAATPDSFPSDQPITHGWDRSRMTMRRMRSKTAESNRPDASSEPCRA